MKIQEKFATLELAIAYILEINGAFKAEVEEKKAALDKVKNLEKDLALSQKATDTANESLDAALAEVGTLSAKLSLQEEHGADGIIVTIKKKNFKLIGDTFLCDGKPLTAEELSKDEKHLEKMLSKGSGSLVALD